MVRVPIGLDEAIRAAELDAQRAVEAREVRLTRLRSLQSDCEKRLAANIHCETPPPPARRPMPSALMLGIVFILVTPSSTWLFVYTLVFAVGLSSLAPEAAMTYQGVIIGLALLVGSVLGPVLSDLADRKRDYRPSLAVVAALTVVGDVGLFAAARLQSLPLFAAAAMLIASSNCTVVPVGNALSGTYAAADPERAGLIAALMLGAITVMPLVGNVSHHPAWRPARRFV